MVVIRLARGGAKKSPYYHVVVADKRYPRDGRYIERVGYFNPMARGQQKRLSLENERITYWLSQGAQLTDRVKNLTKELAKTANAAEPVTQPTKAEHKKAQIEASAKANAQALKEKEAAEKAASKAEAATEDASDSKKSAEEEAK